MKKTNKLLYGIIALLVCIAVLYGVFKINRPKTVEGAKHITMEVVDADEKVTSYELNTDAEYLKGAMDELAAQTDFSFEGSDSDYGFYIDTVNGLKAVYEENNAYWAIYVNGEYGQYGADQQPVADGDVFRLAYEISAW